VASRAPQEAAGSFNPLRPKLLRVAYQMLGSVAEAEDVLQDAFLRWLETDRAAVREPEAFLRRIVTRLCLDVMKSAQRRRETYVGPWLPEPMVEADTHETDDAQDVTLPLMMALERLSPLERAAFLLHDVFGASFDEIAASLGQDPAACRQLASRARTHVRAQRPRFRVPREQGLAIAQAFFAASRGGDLTTLRSLLAADVVAHADGGGKRPAAMTPIVGIEAVLRAHAILAHLFAQHPSRLVRLCMINSLPGLLTLEADGPQTTALEIVEGRIAGIYVVRNPDKLRHLVDTAVH
jgi:RNA polymerase sigma-70 factor, ECF subfamily